MAVNPYKKQKVSSPPSGAPPHGRVEMNRKRLLPKRQIIVPPSLCVCKENENNASSSYFATIYYGKMLCFLPAHLSDQY